MAAAEARLVAGHPRAARALLERAAPDLADPLAKAQASRLEGSILLTNGRVDAATSALLDAVRLAAPRDARLARDTLVEAFGAAQRGQPGRTAEILGAARSLPAVTASEASAGDLLLDGFAAMAEHRYEAGFGLLRQAVDPATTGQSLPDGDPQHFAAFRLVAAELYDDVLWRDLAGRWVAQARDRGALSALVIGMLFLSASQLAEGRFAAAEATIAEARELASVVGEGTYASGLASAELQVLAWRGREDDARAVAGRLLATAGRDTGLRTNRAHRALTVLQLGLGNFQEALAHARAAAFGQPALLFESPPELMVEAAAGCGDQDAAAEALAATEPRWLACATPWSLGLLARCQALVAGDDDRAEAGYLLSIERLQQTRLAPELARSRLLYGEWLRRHRRRRGAREQLRAAHDTFSVLGIEAFAARARAELRAAGEHAFARQAGIPGALTAQEARIARLAAEGSSNQEIAARLFISASTVDYHLRKVFRKLDVTSRVQLGAALGDQDTVR